MRLLSNDAAKTSPSDGRRVPGSNDALDRDEDEHQSTNEDVDPIAAELSVVLDDALYQRGDQDAHERAYQIALAAGEGDAADDDCRDSCQFETCPGVAASRHHVDAVEDAGQGRAKAAEDVDEDFGPVHGEAHKTGRLLVGSVAATHRVDRAAEPSEVRQEETNCEDRKGYNHEVGDVVAMLGGRIGEPRDQNLRLAQSGVRCVMDSNFGIADDVGQPPGEPHACERCDERLHLQVGDEQTHHEPEQHTQQQHDREDSPRVPAHLE